jgi:hypothetical protein
MKAFPQKYPIDASEPHHWIDNPLDRGMDLRDYFAKEAMCFQTWFADTDNEYSAKQCYKIADAMMKARENV